jgi:hypothetical protein
MTLTRAQLRKVKEIEKKLDEMAETLAELKKEYAAEGEKDS